MANITIPQIKSVAYTMLAIFLLAPLFTAWQLQMMGEFHANTWAGLKDFGIHALTSSFWLCVGWLFVKSPFAPRIVELITQARSVAPDGTQTDESTKLTISTPVAADPSPAQVETILPQVMPAQPDPIKNAPVPPKTQGKSSQAKPKTK